MKITDNMKNSIISHFSALGHLRIYYNIVLNHTELCNMKENYKPYIG